jgi:pilus assembly protein Flp/PilA
MKTAILTGVSKVNHPSRKSQLGVTMIEYALIAALISIVAIVLLGGIGDQLLVVFQSILDALSG